MSEPVPILVAKVERQLGLVRSAPGRGDADCPPLDVLEWFDDFQALYATLPEPPPGPDMWEQVRSRMEERTWRKLSRTAGLWRLSAAVLAVLVLGLGAMLWTDRVTRSSSSPPALVASVPKPTAPTPAPAEPLMATMQQTAGEQETLFVLVADPRGAVIRSTPADVTRHPGHMYRLWVDDSEKIVLVGQVSPSISHSLPVAPDYRGDVKPGLRLIVTLDPEAADDRLDRDRIVARGQLDSI